ncbi:hypothetical protein ACTA71_011482 [Dictyostelium dimigraforme]
MLLDKVKLSIASQKTIYKLPAFIREWSHRPQCVSSYLVKNKTGDQKVHGFIDAYSRCLYTTVSAEILTSNILDGLFESIAFFGRIPDYLQTDSTENKSHSLFNYMCKRLATLSSNQVKQKSTYSNSNHQFNSGQKQLPGFYKIYFTNLLWLDVPTGREGISSSSDLSFTKESTIYTTNYGFSIYDTPGINPLEEKFKQNIWIAHAFNSDPVSVLLLCVMAETRIDTTLNNVVDLLTRFGKFETILCPLITCMDKVEWDEEKFRRIYTIETGLKNILFNGNKKSPDVLGQEISNIAEGNQPLIIKIDSDAVENFQKSLSYTQEKDKMDLVFQFQHFMSDNIPKMQEKLANECNFILGGKQWASEFGHLQHLGSKLKCILYQIRQLAKQYASEHGVTNLRKCPHCALIWSKVIGCNGETICGNRPDGSIESKSNVFSKFSFSLYPFEVTRIGEKDLKLNAPKCNTNGVGCGKKIVWELMAPFPVPKDIMEIKNDVKLDDIKGLPDGRAKKFEELYNDTVAEITNSKNHFII